MNLPRLSIVAGLPGSGKTSLALELAGRFDASRMCPDDWMIAAGIELWDEAARARIEQCQFELTIDRLKSGRNVIIEWGTWTRQERDVLRDAARSTPAMVELHCLAADLDELWRRISERNTEALFGYRAIARRELAMWHARFESPTSDELALYDPPLI